MKTKTLQDSYFLAQTSEEKTNESYGTYVAYSVHSGPRERGLRAQSATTWLCIYSDKAPELPKETPENKKILHSNVLGQPGQGERRQQQARQGRQGRGTRQRWEHRGEAEMTIIIIKKVDYFLRNGNLNDNKFLLIIVDENFYQPSLLEPLPSCYLAARRRKWAPPAQKKEN